MQRILRFLAVSSILLASIPMISAASHRSRGRQRARTERSTRTRGRGKREARARGRRGEHLSREERGRERREGYASTRRGRRYEARCRRHHRVTYESREGAGSSARPASTGIPTDRVTEIQRALIKEGYLE